MTAPRDEVYEELTDGLERRVRASALVAAAHDRGMLASGEEGEFLADILVDARTGAHLVRTMAEPRAESVALLDDFAHTGSVDLGPMRLDRRGTVGLLSIQNHGCLNAEDDASTAAMEIAIDLVLLDDGIEIGVLRGAPATHPKHAGRRIFGSGINLTALYEGNISFVGFFIERELGPVSKMFRGLGADGPEKPWIAAVDAFAIGGACQWLLVMDRVIAETGSYFTLPAREEGIVPGCAALRLPRVVGERLARQAIFFGRRFDADTPEGRLIADEVVPAAQIEDAVEYSAAELLSAGTASLVANRRAFRAAYEPLDSFRRYMGAYAREQARCLASPALMENLERNWTGTRRASAAVGDAIGGSW